jgi:hypothetical protein
MTSFRPERNGKPASNGRRAPSRAALQRAQNKRRRSALQQTSDGAKPLTLSLPADQLPDVLQVQPDSVPQSMKDARRWVCWRLVERDGRLTKVPVDAKSGGPASTTDPDTWAPFDAAIDHYHTEIDVGGVGFVLGDGWAGMDLDGCVDPETGAVAQWALDLLAELGPTYAELSPSGTGIHALVVRLPSIVRREEIPCKDPE